MRTTTLRRTLKTTLAVTATGALMGLGLGAASAHVSATPDSTAANSYSLVTLAIGHGCDGSPTNKVTITLPEELNDATPTVNPNWTISKTTQKLAAPKKLDNGSSITERTSAIVYTAKAPLDAHQRDTFVLSVKLPDAAGKTLYFPTLQSCVKGETDWKEIPAPGQSHDDLNAPAPSVAVTAAVTGDGHGGHGTADMADAADITTTDDGGSQAPGWIGLGAGLAGLVLGGIAFLRTRGSKASAK
jgi:periplasmic copper chaperone A